MKKLSLLAAVVIAGAAATQTIALADMSASFDRSANVNGLQQKLSSSVSLSSFQANIIGYNIYQRMGDPRQSMLLGAVPGMPFPSPRAKQDYLAVLAALHFAHPQKLCHSAMRSMPGEAGAAYRVIRYSECYALHAGGSVLPAGDLDGHDVNSASSAIGEWAAWAIFHGVFTPMGYANQLDVLAPSMMWNPANVNYFTNRVVWQVQAYINAYAYGPGGFSTGNMLPLVPLCMAGQANTCGIPPGYFDPQASQQQLLEQVRAWSKRRDAAAAVRIDREVRAVRQRLLASGIPLPANVSAPAATTSLSGTWKPGPRLIQQRAQEERRAMKLRQALGRDATCRQRLGLSANAATWTQQQIAAHARCVLGS